MNLDYYLKKKHIFKKRIFKKYKHQLSATNQYLHLYTIKSFKLEYVYIRLFKKLLRRKYIKATTRFFKLKFWLTLQPNYILTKKSKNSRMGAGKGVFIRLTRLIDPGKTLLRTQFYKYTFLCRLNNYLNYKLSKSFLIK